MPIAAYLSLIPHHKHADSCKFNVNTYLSTLVAASSKLELMAPSLIESPAGYRFRLNYLAEAHAELRALCRGAGAEDAVPRAGTDFVPSAQRLAPYFRSAAGVARLRALALSAKEVENLIVIQYRERTISWKDFYFDDDCYLKLFKMLRSNGRTLRHPVALAVTPKRYTESEGRNGQRYIVQCYAQVSRVPGEHRPKVVVPRLYWSEGVKAGRLGDEAMGHGHIVLGYPDAPPCQPGRDERAQYLNLNVNIFGTHQVSQISNSTA